MKKFLKILGIFLLIIILIIGTLLVVYRDTIKSIYIGLTYSQDEIEAGLNDSRENLQKDLGEQAGITLRDVSEEEKKQIASGEKTEAEVFEERLNEALQEFINSNEAQAEQKQPEKLKRTYDEIVADYTARLYSLKNTYLGKLDSLIGIAEAEFTALPRPQRTVGNRSKVISKYIARAAQYESECDAKVDSLVSALKAELKEIGADYSIVETILQVYNQEKAAKISYYTKQLK